MPHNYCSETGPITNVQFFFFGKRSTWFVRGVVAVYDVGFGDRGAAREVRRALAKNGGHHSYWYLGKINKRGE